MDKKLIIFGTISYLLIIISTVSILTTRYDNPFYFYSNINCVSEIEGCEILLHNIKNNSTNEKYQELLILLAMNHYDLESFRLAQRIIRDSHYVNLDTLIRLSQIYYLNLPENFTWEISYPVSSPRRFQLDSLQRTYILDK